MLKSPKPKEQDGENIETEEKVTETGGEADLPETFVIDFYEEPLRGSLHPQLNKRNNIFPYSLFPIPCSLVSPERSQIEVVKKPGISYDNLRQWLSRAKSIFRGLLKKFINCLLKTSYTKSGLVTPVILGIRQKADGRWQKEKKV
ncbi:MAG: hypothetical protein F6K47_32005 [Symploca sp. SIO2E6]|nr:hypothetical protein [Symploca sp. SIO2E6]